MQGKQRDMNKQAKISPEPLGHKKSKTWQSILKFSCAVGVIAICSGYFLTTAFSGGDDIDRAELQKISEGMKNLGATHLKKVTEPEWDEAISSIPLDKQSKELLTEKLTHYKNQLIENKNTVPEKAKLVLDDFQLVWLDLWDFAKQDGDIVQVSSAGYSIQVNLLKGVSRIAIPVDASHSVNITGMVDGGGGITLGVNSSGQALSLVISPGQNYPLAVIF